MLDFSHIPGTDVTWLTGASTTAVGTGMTWQSWQKPRGKTMCSILLLGKGGNGGNGVVGANSTAAGGGGGGSGGMTTLTMPLALLPDILYFSLAGQQATTTVASYVTIYPSIIATPPPNHTLMIANGGGNGGNGAAAVAGAAGAAGAIATVATMPLGWQWAKALAGQAGIIGGTTVAGAALTLPVTGLIVTGGTGGGGLPAAATAGTTGGSFTVPAQPSPFIPHTAPASTATATVPPGDGAGGFKLANLLYFYGGLGSGSTHGTATGAGLVAARGGAGAFGCGGGGGGGALTGSTASTGGFGGPALAIINCW